jgi:hypothetical protein
MIDFLEAGAGSAGPHIYGDYHDSRLVKGPEVYRNALRACREAAGEETYLLASSGPTLLNVALVDAVRTGNDYGEGRALYPESYFYPATFVINNPVYWTSHAYATNNMAATYFTHRKLYINDSGNVMTVDKPIPMNDAQITATIFAICGGPMMIGDDIERMSAERLALIRKCLPRTNEVAFPVDLFDSVAPDYPKIFHLKIRQPWDEWDIVAVFNYDDEPRRETIAFSRLGLDPSAAYAVWEFWNEQYLGAKKDSFVAAVPPRSARLYRIARQRSHPWLLSTDMHALQGQVEILECGWDAVTSTLSGKAFRPKGHVGNLFIVVPPGLRLADPRRHWVAKDAREGVLIVRKELRFDGRPVSWAVGFQAIAGVASRP